MIFVMTEIAAFFAHQLLMHHAISHIILEMILAHLWYRSIVVFISIIWILRLLTILLLWLFLWINLLIHIISKTYWLRICSLMVLTHLSLIASYSLRVLLSIILSVMNFAGNYYWTHWTLWNKWSILIYCITLTTYTII